MMINTAPRALTILSLMLLLFSLALPLLAQESSPQSPSGAISLDQAISEAIRNNRELKAARYDLELAGARLITAGAFPNPEMQSEQSTDVTFSNEGEYGFSAGLSQPFPVTGRINRQKSVAKVDIKIAESSIADQQRLLTSEVKKEFYDLLLSDAQIDLIDTLIQTARDLAAMTETRFKRGEISQVDVSTAQLELQRLIVESERLVVDRQGLQNSFNRLLGRSASAPVSIEGSLERREAPEALAALTEQALQSRPDLMTVSYNVERARAEQMLAKALKWEDWSAGISYTRERSIFTDAVPNPLRDTDQLFHFGISIPLPLWDKKAGPLAEAQVSERKAQAQVEALRLGIAAEVNGAYARLSKMGEILDLYNSSVLVAAEQNVDLTQKAYKQGMANFLQVILATQQLGNQRQSYLDALAEYQQARVDLETAVGKPPVAENFEVKQ
jgi:cobalt-zinc-cadmium efflux system outer membrane protein